MTIDLVQSLFMKWGEIFKTASFLAKGGGSQSSFLFQKTELVPITLGKLYNWTFLPYVT